MDRSDPFDRVDPYERLDAVREEEHDPIAACDPQLEERLCRDHRAVEELYTAQLLVDE
jgi:hypothetical protein